MKINITPRQLVGAGMLAAICSAIVALCTFVVGWKVTLGAFTVAILATVWIVVGIDLLASKVNKNGS